MIAVNKRGQFFLVATFIIVSIIFSFGIIYNSARSASSDLNSEAAANLADSIKYESVQMINNQLYNNATSSEISGNITALINASSISNPQYNLTFIYGTNPFSAGQIKSGLYHPISAESTSVNVTLSLNNMEYIFNTTNGYNFFIIVQKEENNERYISTA